MAAKKKTTKKKSTRKKTTTRRRIRGTGDPKRNNGSLRGTLSNALKLDDETIELVCGFIRRGYPLSLAGAAARISESTLRAWMSYGKQFIENDGKPAEFELHGAFYQEFHEARAAYLGGFIDKHLQPDKISDRARYAIEVLRRRDRDNWKAIDTSTGPNEVVADEADERYL